ncbi:MAG: flagellar hook-associated protein FlgL [bacterium]
MRITNNLILRNSLAGLQINRAAIQQLQTQIASGDRIATASDDPTGASQLMSSSSSLGAIDQYKRNIDSATSRNVVEDSAFSQVTDLLTRAREITVAESTGTSTAASRQIASKEMESIFNSVVAIGNAKLGDAYVFGGSQATTPPFTSTGGGATLDYTTTNPTGAAAVEVSAGLSLAPTHDGTQAFISSGVLTSLRDATRALAANDMPGIAASLGALDASFQEVQSLSGENGARRNTLDITSQNLDALKVNLTSFRASIQGIDIEAAVTTLVTKQTAYQAAMAVTSRVLSLTLTDYLR